jgi:hypothetical protein
MRLAIAGASVVTGWAALITVASSFDPLKPSHLVASAILTSAAVVQRVEAINRWLTPSRKREEQVRQYAQQTLINLCSNRPVADDILGLTIHVWEVPLWYRKLFPYPLRQSLRSAVRRKRLRAFSTWLIRPSLKRVAAVGLLKPSPSGVRFCKGTGLVGVCLANNDRSEFLSLRVNDVKYRRALKAKSEAEWQGHGLEITHNLSLQDARKLSHSYGQVMAHVIRNLDSGEAIGCVTISVADAASPNLQIVRSAEIKSKLVDLAMSVATVLA